MNIGDHMLTVAATNHASKGSSRPAASYRAVRRNAALLAYRAAKKRAKAQR